MAKQIGELIIPENIDEALECNILELYALIENPELLKAMKPVFEKIQANFNSEAIDYCISNFLDAELDFQTHGDRGIGRTTSFIPRLGAYIRKYMKKFTTEDMILLRASIQGVILTRYLRMGYIIYTLSLSDELFARKVDSNELYKAWIPTIYYSVDTIIDEITNKYVTQITNVPEEIQEAFENLWLHFVLSTLENIINKYNIKINGILSKNKLPTIFDYYSMAGRNLRVLEIMEANDRERVKMYALSGGIIT